MLLVSQTVLNHADADGFMVFRCDIEGGCAIGNGVLMFVAVIT